MADTETSNEAAVLAEEAAKKRAREISQNDGLGSFFAGIYELVKNLFTAIVGAFTDRKSEYSLVSEDEAKPTGWGENGKKRAEEFISSIGNDKLRALAEEYQGKTLVNISPLKVDAKITSHLGHREQSKKANGQAVGSTEHNGIDLVPAHSSQTNVEVVSTIPGVVVRSEMQRDKKGNPTGFGNWVEVAGIDGIRRRYAHLKDKGAPVGTVLHQGEAIGIMGNTGDSTAPHLHYEWRDAGGKSLEPEIEGKKYARNNSSYVGTKVAAASSPAVSTLVGRNGYGNLPVADADHGAKFALRPAALNQEGVVRQN